MPLCYIINWIVVICIRYIICGYFICIRYTNRIRYIIYHIIYIIYYIVYSIYHISYHKSHIIYHMSYIIEYIIYDILYIIYYLLCIILYIYHILYNIFCIFYIICVYIYCLICTTIDIDTLLISNIIMMIIIIIRYIYIYAIYILYNVIGILLYTYRHCQVCDFYLNLFLCSVVGIDLSWGRMHQPETHYALFMMWVMVFHRGLHHLNGQN